MREPDWDAEYALLQLAVKQPLKLQSPRVRKLARGLALRGLMIEEDGVYYLTASGIQFVGNKLH